MDLAGIYQSDKRDQSLDRGPPWLARYTTCIYVATVGIHRKPDGLPPNSHISTVWDEYPITVDNQSDNLLGKFRQRLIPQASENAREKRPNPGGRRKILKKTLIVECSIERSRS